MSTSSPDRVGQLPVASQLLSGGRGAERLVTFGKLTVRDSTFLSNTAGSDGGAIASQTADATVATSTFEGNSATFGGAIAVSDFVNLEQSTFHNNFAQDGGGLALYGNVNRAHEIVNNTFSGNTATDRGGGLVNVSWARLANNTVTGNHAPLGGGIHNVFQNPSSRFLNNLVAGNAAEESGPDALGPFTSLGGNLMGDGTGSTGFTQADD